MSDICRHTYNRMQSECPDCYAALKDEAEHLREEVLKHEARADWLDLTAKSWRDRAERAAVRLTQTEAELAAAKESLAWEHGIAKAALESQERVCADYRTEKAHADALLALLREQNPDPHYCRYENSCTDSGRNPACLPCRINEALAGSAVCPAPVCLDAAKEAKS